jgi:uncharacterized protein YebE (UPF0316 family)
VCFKYCVIYVLTFSLVYENMINVHNIQCYMLFIVFGSWFVILWIECRLSAFNSSVIRKLNINGDEVI